MKSATKQHRPLTGPMLLACIVSGLIAAVATWLLVGMIVVEPAGGGDYRIWIVLQGLMAVLAWTGVWGWWTGRPGLATLGGWAGTFGNLWLSGLLIVPFAMAIVSTVWLLRSVIETVNRRRGVTTILLVGVLVSGVGQVTSAKAADAREGIICQGYAPGERSCVRDEVATRDITTVSWINALSVGGFVATIEASGGYRDVLTCAAYPTGHRCEGSSTGPMPRAGERVVLNVQVAGSGLWRVALYYADVVR